MSSVLAASDRPSRWARFVDSDLWYSFRHSPTAIVAAAIALLCVVCAVFAHWVAPHNPFDLATLDLIDARLPPAWIDGGSAKYLLGTDDQGRDILSALMYGSRISLLVGLASVLLSMLIGVGLGLLAGFAGGAVDGFIMRVCDVMLSFPSILIALLIDGVGRALFPNAHESLAFSRADVCDRADGLGAVRAHGARLDDGGAQQGIRAGRAGDRRGAVARRCSATCLPNVLGPVLVLATIQIARRDHHRGDAVLSGRRRAAHLAVAGHADPHRQGLSVLAANGGSPSFPA